MVGSKHGEVYEKSAPVYQKHRCFGQTPKSSSKVLFKLDLFAMAPFIVVLGTQI